MGVEASILLSYTHKNEWNTHDGPPTRCQRSAMGVSLIFVGVRQQNGCFDTHTFIQFSTYVMFARIMCYFDYASLTMCLHIRHLTTYYTPLTICSHIPRVYSVSTHGKDKPSLLSVTFWLYAEACSNLCFASLLLPFPLLTDVCFARFARSLASHPKFKSQKMSIRQTVSPKYPSRR